MKNFEEFSDMGYPARDSSSKSRAGSPCHRDQSTQHNQVSLVWLLAPAIFDLLIFPFVPFVPFVPS